MMRITNFDSSVRQNGRLLATFLSIIISVTIFPQQRYELNRNWFCKNINEVDLNGEDLSQHTFPLSEWLPATVPGTILTTLLNNQLVPDPFWGMNNDNIPDIFQTGNNYYTYWFVNDFKEIIDSKDQQVWLHFRGINYGCDIYLNGKKLNKSTHYGMFLRQTYNITSLINKDGQNRLAVLVYPPDPAGNPNGGQGGDGTIAKNVTHQYVAGWDWIQPVRDRNTGIWDKVFIEKTKLINLKNPKVITKVTGIHNPNLIQEPVLVELSVEIENPTTKLIKANLSCSVENLEVNKEIVLYPTSQQIITLPEIKIENPRLWWPNGYGKQELYTFHFQVNDKNGNILDNEQVITGIREIKTKWNERTRSIQVEVNGKKIFIKGGNWIVSDAMLRLSKERYDAEIRMHRDMNLNLIRIWGGALLERPEFYEACDKYGLLVMQDFWFTGDCNGKWLDPMKKEDQRTRRQYPDDHQLLIQSAADQIRMIRNHPSLAFWCGGNEITPPSDILSVIQDSLLPVLDDTRYFFPYSNSYEMSYNFLGTNGDGPYTIQPVDYFWEKQGFPFNSEIGSVGTGDYESLKRFIPEKHLIIPDYQNKILDPVWVYHKDIGYENYIDKYGTPNDIKDFTLKAQLVNYNQYRALIEGYSSHMWEWYTGLIIWKTQNPWTALRGQMYDYYLDPNAGMFATRRAAEPIHVMCNPVDGMVSVVNNTFFTQRDLFLEATTYDISGKKNIITKLLVETGPGLTQKYFSVTPYIHDSIKNRGGFLALRLFNQNNKLISKNIYWLPDTSDSFTYLQQMDDANVRVHAKKISDKKIELVLNNSPDGPLAFFIRIALVDAETNERVLPVFYEKNYVSLLPGEELSLILENASSSDLANLLVSVSGWNMEKQYITIKLL